MASRLLVQVGPERGRSMTTIGNPRVVFFAVAFVAGLGVVLGPSPAYGLACGDTIQTDTVLTADLGPCPGSALAIAYPGGSLNLNGFTISGSGGGIAISVDNENGSTIQGPGTISNFGTAIRSRHTPLTVQGVYLTENTEGIVIIQSSSPRVINNTIDGGARGVVGIFVGEISSAKIKGNVITGHSGAGIDISSYNGSASVIVLNFVTKNGTGLIYRDVEATPITIRDNEFSDNVQDGVSISNSFLSLTLDLNTIKRNGRNGVSVSGLARGPLVIADNVVDDNGSQGIALANIVDAASYPIQIVDNEVLNNAAVDLFWDGTGTNNCWKFNTFGSSDPATLPACP
jgi:hypothetical protein